MRDDLLPAKASVDWAVSNFPSLKRRLSAWLKDNVHVEIKELESGGPHDVIVAIEKEPLPIAFNVEVGAYINAIRSGLDVLACCLALRYGIKNIEDMYFPVARSGNDFLSGKYKGHKFVKGLPPAERAIIESLEPYKGGHKLLWPLHQLDIVRKHQRLLEIDISPRTFSVFVWGNIDDQITRISGGWRRTTNQETKLALIKKGAPKPEMKLTPQVLLSEPILGPKPLTAALDGFASAANAIINRFDTP
jgi:hypothetical protein